MVRLGDIGHWSGGNTPSKANPAYWTDGTVPWVSPKDMKVDEIASSEDQVTTRALDEGRLSLVPEDSILIVTRSGILAHTLPVAVTKIPVTINQDLKALTPQTGFSSKYVALAVKGASQRILKSCSKHGTTVASVDTNALLNFEIPMVGLAEQHTTVAEIEKQFSRLDEAVANLQRVKANLMRYKAAVLKDALGGRLVPTEAELAAHEGRGYESGKALLERALHLRRSSWSGRGKYKEPPSATNLPATSLPIGWTWAAIEQLASLVTSGSRGWSEFYSPDGVLFIRAQDLKTDALLLDGVARVNVPSDAEGTRSSVDAGDVLVTITGANVTKSARVASLGEIAFVSQHVALVKFTMPELSPFAYLWIVSPANGRKTLDKWAYGAGKPGLSLEQVRALPVALPPLAEQIRIVAEVDRRLSIVREVEAEVDANMKRANVLRQSVLARVFAPAVN